MPVALKIVLLFGATWVGPLVLSLIFTGIVAGATSSWSASRVGVPMLLVMLLDLVLAAAGSYLFWRGLSVNLRETAPRIVTFLGHTALQLATVALLLFGTLVAFNR